MAQMSFNANAVTGDVANFDNLPPGKYNAVIVKTELEKPNERGTEQLRIEWEVTDGPCEKRHISTWVTVACTTEKGPQAVDIGMRFLKNVCEAVGMAGFTDTDELCGRRHVIDVGTRKKQDSTTTSEVKRCYPAGQPAQQVTSPQQPAQATAFVPAQPVPSSPPVYTPPAAAKPPWMK